MKPHPSCINHLVDTPDGLGYLTGNRQEQEVVFTTSEHKKWLRYKFGVRLLQDDVERFYLPRTVWEVQPRATQADEQAPRDGSASRSREFLHHITEKSRDRPGCLQDVGSLSGVIHRIVVGLRWAISVMAITLVTESHLGSRPVGIAHTKSVWDSRPC